MIRQSHGMDGEKGFASWQILVSIGIIMLAFVGLIYILTLDQGLETYDVTPVDSNTKFLVRSHNDLSEIQIELMDKNNVKFEIDKQKILNASFHEVNLTSNFEIGIDTEIINLKIEGYNTANAYAIDPTKIDFSNATFVINATGKQLFKCVEYDFEKQNCYGEWKKIKNLVPGQEYNLLITKLDPAFIETNESQFDLGIYNRTFYNETISALQLNYTFNNGTYLSNVIDATSLASWTNISFVEGVPYGEELPNNQEVEAVFGGANMSGNLLLLHLNNDSIYGESSTHIYDFSGNGHNGTWNGDVTPDIDSGPTNSGKHYGAFMFDGVGDTITGSFVGGTKTFTLSAWIKPDVLSGVRGCIGYTTTGGVRQDLYQYNQAVRIFADGKYYVTTTNAITQIGKWYNIIGTYTEGDAKPKVYVNGIEYSLGSSSNVGTYTTNQFWVGRISPNGDYEYDGTIDEVAIYNRVLSTEEILDNYKRGVLRLNLTTRSCNDENCENDEWNKTYENSSIQNLNVEDNRYFQYKANYYSEDASYSPELYNVTIGYEILDNTAPVINLEDPVNETIEIGDKTPDFSFNATDETASTIDCSLWMNATSGGTAQEKATNSSVISGISTILTPTTPLSNDLYYWWVSCSDGYNSNLSQKRTINMSVPDQIAPSISLVGPNDNAKNTTDNTPDFSFIPSDNKAESLSCDLWMNVSGIAINYGYDLSIANGSTGTITANAALSNQNYTWWINCSDGTNSNISQKREIQIYVDVNSPVVSLNSPSNMDNSVDFNSVGLECSATDDTWLKNISLYSDYGGDWQFVENKIISGISDSALFTKNIYPTNKFVNNYYTWNCLAYDNTSKSNWSSTNYSFSNWDLGSHSNTLYNNTLSSVTLSDYSSDGIYSSDVFDAGSIVGWKNISWSKETSSSGELPDNKGSDSRINMLDNTFLAHLNDGTEAETFEDNSGENNDASCIVGKCPTWDAVGKYNGGFVFDSSNEEIIIGPSSNDITGDNAKHLTISVWFKTESIDDLYPASLKRQPGPTYSTLFSMTVGHGGAGNVGLLTYNAAGAHTYLDLSGSYNDGEWHHLVGVINNSNRTIYIDGKPGVSDLAGIYPVTGNTGEFTIGGFSSTQGDLFFDGTIDEIAIWNRSLSPEEVSNIYNTTATSLNLSVRSCDDSNCNGESWSVSLGNSTLSELPVSSNRYFQYKANLESSGTFETPKLYNVTINYGESDIIKPSISLILPQNKSGDNGDLTNFSYIVDDENDISNCKLIFDGTVIDSDDFVEKGATQTFAIYHIFTGTYNWHINCSDLTGNENSSNIRVLTVVPSYEYTGKTTDLSNIDIEDITNFVLEKPNYGLINFSESINLSSGADINSYVRISNNLISIDSDNLPQLNKSAKLTLYNLNFVNPVILKNSQQCTDCNIVTYDENLTFTVQSFSSYSASENSKLEIWDDTDLIRKTTRQKIKFYTNYSNTTSSESIAGANCNITFVDTGTSTMNYNAGSSLYEYNRTFSTANVYYFNVSCDGSSLGFTVLNTTDYTSVNNRDGPKNVNITVLGSERSNFSIPLETQLVEGGNVTGLNLNTTIITPSWQGYYGNISGKIVLTNALGNNFYDWDVVTPTGEVYATRAIDVNFATVNCTDASEILTEESFIGQTTNDGDSVNNTFNQQLHPEFSVGSLTLAANSCKSTNINVNSSSQSSNFYEVLISDSASNLVYTSIIDADQAGFDSNSYDFQMLVGENGHNGDTQTTPYYFFMELG
jgi:hypothetical protein